MCFRLDFNVNRRITDDYRKVAKEDISVIKIVRGLDKTWHERKLLGMVGGSENPDFVSVYEFFGYNIGGSYETEIHVCDDDDDKVGGCLIDGGFHSYVPSMVSIRENGGLAEVVANNTFRTLDWFSYGIFVYESGLHVMECVIPKGSAYYVNVYGEAVSERLRVVGSTCLTEYMKGRQ